MAINNELNARLQHAVDAREIDGRHPDDATVPLQGEIIFHLNREGEFDSFKLGTGRDEDEYALLNNFLLVHDGGNASNFLRGDGSWGSAFTGATGSSQAGVTGLVPAPPSTTYSNNKVLLSDSTWGNVPNSAIPNLTSKTYNNVNLVNNSAGTPQQTKSITITGNVSEETWYITLEGTSTQISRKMLISQ